MASIPREMRGHTRPRPTLMRVTRPEKFSVSFLMRVTVLQTFSCHTWQGIRWHEDAIHIEYTDDDYVLGTYYITVYGFESTIFTITVDLTVVGFDEPSIVLLNGLPQVRCLDLCVSRKDTSLLESKRCRSRGNSEMMRLEKNEGW